MRYFLLVFVLAVGLVFGIAGKRGRISRKPPIEVFSDMDRQPKIRPQTPSEFFADGRAFSILNRTESTRLICPAPTPTVWPPAARTIALDFTCFATRQAK